jgi:hypothetical protein
MASGEGRLLRQDFENLIVYYDKCLNKFGNYVEK